MRLYLSSFRFGTCPDRLVSLAGGKARVALILNALDNFTRVRDEWHATQLEGLTNLGFSPHELDLRRYFQGSSELQHALEGIDLLWINGGNSFLLRRAMRQSGLDTIIGALLASDRLVYAGFSAAVCCATPTLRGTELVDDPGATSEGYMPEIVWDGLGLIDYQVAVHYKSNHSESASVQSQINYYQQQNLRYATLRDGEAIVIDGARTEIVGRPPIQSEE